MAIDTAQKRRSAAGVPFLPLGVGVTPDAAKPLAWRQQAGWGYSGIPVSEPESELPPGVVLGTLSISARSSGSTAISARASGTITVSARPLASITVEP